MKNIIVINDYCYIEGGASKVAISSAVALAEQDEFHVYFVGAVGPVCNELKASKIRRIYTFAETDCLHNRNRLKGICQNIYNRELATEVDRILAQFDPMTTLIHVHTWTKAWSGAMFRKCIDKEFPIAITAHDYFLICPNGGLFNFKTKRKCDLIPNGLSCKICNCDSRSYLHKLLRLLRFSKQQSALAIKGAKLNIIYISNYSRTRIDKHLTVEHNSYFLNDPIDIMCTGERARAESHDEFVYIGRVAEEKGIRLFCDAITKSGYKGTVIGNGPLYEELKKSCPAVSFMGWRDKQFIKEYLTEKARAIVFSSFWGETLGMTVLEGQAYGIPSITSDNTATCENVENGETGLVFENGNIDRLIEAMNTMQSDSIVEKMSKNCYNRFDLQRWSMNSHVSGIIKIYNEILERTCSNQTNNNL